MTTHVLLVVVTAMASLIAMGEEVCQSALQSLELLVMGNDNLLQPIILDQLITITLHQPLDQQTALLVSKILGCYANNEEVCIYGQNVYLNCNYRGRGYWYHMIIS